MSFSEYSGSKGKVSQAVGRILKNAQENLPRIQLQRSQVTALLKSIPTPGNSNGSERTRLNMPSPPITPTSSKFGFQKLRLPRRDKKRQLRAELLDNQDTGDDMSSGDEMESHTSLIGPVPQKQKHKRLPF